MLLGQESYLPKHNTSLPCQPLCAKSVGTYALSMKVSGLGGPGRPRPCQYTVSEKFVASPAQGLFIKVRGLGAGAGQRTANRSDRLPLWQTLNWLVQMDIWPALAQIQATLFPGLLGQCNFAS